MHTNQFNFYDNPNIYITNGVQGLDLNKEYDEPVVFDVGTLFNLASCAEKMAEEYVPLQVTPEKPKTTPICPPAPRKQPEWNPQYAKAAKPKVVYTPYRKRKEFLGNDPQDLDTIAFNKRFLRENLKLINSSIYNRVGDFECAPERRRCVCCHAILNLSIEPSARVHWKITQGAKRGENRVFWWDTEECKREFMFGAHLAATVGYNWKLVEVWGF